MKINNGNRTERRTIQGVIGRVVSRSAERAARSRFEIKSTITPELYDTKSYYQLIVTITKYERNITVDKLFDRLIYSTSKLDVVKDNPFKCN